eukprot:4781812-Amphidinium_carterae.1
MLCGPQKVGDLEYHETCTHRADVFTKPLERVKFQQACSWHGLQSLDCTREGGEKKLAVCAPVSENTLSIKESKTNDSRICCCMDRDCKMCCHAFLSTKVEVLGFAAGLGSSLS